jgi:ribosome-associated toxin RatA of RatAB toxin-antitoxin module
LELNVRKVGIVLAVLPLAFGAGTAAAADTEVVRRGSTFEVHATIEAGGSVQLCYAVLTDFDRLAEFIPGMVSSRIVSNPGEPLQLRQSGRTRIAFSEYVFDVTLAVELDAPREIRFRRVAGTLRRMQGRWLIAGDEARCTIDYRAEIEPGLWVPPLIGPMLMRSQVAKQVEGLEYEIERRMRSAAAP